MKRCLLFVVSVGAMALVAAVAFKSREDASGPLSWAARAQAETPTVAVLLEFGIKDLNVRDWSGRAMVEGAKVSRREGYRFRTGDKLVAADAWEMSSHRALRAPKGAPQISKIEPIASVGVVLHLEQINVDARLIVELKDNTAEKVDIALKDVLAGKTVKLWKGEATVRLVSTAAGVATSNLEEDYPAAAYGPDGTLWVAYVGYHVKEDSRRIEPPMLREQPADFKKYYTPGFRDQVFVKHYRQGQWSKAIAVTDAQQDIARCAIGVNKDGHAWVVYSTQRDGNFDLYGKQLLLDNNKVKARPEERLTTDSGPDIHPAMCTDSNGELWLACQSWSDKGQAGIRVLRQHDGKWKDHDLITGAAGENCWHPALAADLTGKVAVAYDIYRDNSDYDVHVRVIDVASGKSERHVIANTFKFEARPSVAYDKSGRLWIAYEEGPEHWGKDYGALAPNKGNPLYNQRNVRVVCLDKGELKTPAAELPKSSYEPPVLPFEPVKTNQYEKAPRYAYPRIGVDLHGRVWLTYRHNFGSRYTTHPGAYWLTFARRLDAAGWSEPIEVHHSDGLLDHRPVLLPHVSGGLLIVHNTDGRYTTPEKIDNQIFASVLRLPDQAGDVKLVALSPVSRGRLAAASAEREAVKRIRAYRIAAAGKKYQILRGEFHRHTEISWDGSPDGSLEDMFRYGIDCAAFDWIGNGDHDSGAGREYSWHLIQKHTDAFHVARAFTPMFTYERSVPYPHGHRNCMFAQRGVRTLPRLAGRENVKEEGGVHPDDAKMLYRYLHEHNGICASHTSATSMGTDWRDNDPVVEPIVEIYQGDRMSYEHEGAPRAGYDPKTNQQPANVAGWFPKGFISNALGDKKYKLGFQASSDHWSTHISYCMVLAESHDRQAILDAIKKRHVYGATDNIIVDFRCCEAIMGDDVKVNGAPTFDIAVHGTSLLAKIDVLRDSQVVATLQPQGEGYRTTWTDPQPQAGTHYYYIRVLQRDNEIAWGSPIWVECQK